MEVDLEKDVLTDIASGKQYPLKSIGEVKQLLCVLAAQVSLQLLKTTKSCSCSCMVLSCRLVQWLMLVEFLHMLGKQG